MNEIGLYVFYINFCVERFEVSDNRRHTIYGSTLNDFSTIFFFAASSVRAVAVVVIASFLLAFFLSATRKKFPSNGDGSSNGNSGNAGRFLWLYEWKYKNRTIHRLESGDTLAASKNIFWWWCALFHFFPFCCCWSLYLSFALLFSIPFCLSFSLSLLIIIMIFEVSTVLERYCTFWSGMPNSMAGLYVNKYKYFIHGKCGMKRERSE